MPFSIYLHYLKHHSNACHVHLYDVTVYSHGNFNIFAGKIILVFFLVLW